MKISIIISVYNVENFLAQCLESAVCQTHKDLEIIVVDDGSPDDSAKIYEQYAAADPRIKIIKQKNGGVSAVRNNGIDSATGDYIHFMDGDDYVDLDYYEKAVRAVEIAPESDIIALGMASQNADYFNIAYDSTMILKSVTEKFKATNAMQNGSSCRYLFRRDFLIKNNLRFIVGRHYCEDVVFMLDAMPTANRVITVPGPRYHYVANPGSILHERYVPKSSAQLVEGNMRRLDFIEKHGLHRIYNIDEIIVKRRLFGLTLAKTTIQNGRHGGKCCRYWLFGIKLPMKKLISNRLIWLDSRL